MRRKWNNYIHGLYFTHETQIDMLQNKRIPKIYQKKKLHKSVLNEIFKKAADSSIYTIKWNLIINLIF